MNTTLKQRIDDKLALWQLLAESGGEISPQIETWLNEIETNLAEKVDNYKLFLDEIENEAERLKTQSKLFNEASKQLTNLHNRIKDNIKFAMTKLETDTMNGQNFKFKLTNPIAKINIDEDKLPLEYKKKLEEYVPDSDKIRIDVELGKTIPGVMVEYKPGLRTYINKGVR